MRNGRDSILTIASNYYYLRGDRAEPAEHVAPCQGIGVGSRPLLAKDGMSITTFVRGLVVVLQFHRLQHDHPYRAAGREGGFLVGQP